MVHRLIAILLQQCGISKGWDWRGSVLLIVYFFRRQHPFDM